MEENKLPKKTSFTVTVKVDLELTEKGNRYNTINWHCKIDAPEFMNYKVKDGITYQGVQALLQTFVIGVSQMTAQIHIHKGMRVDKLLSEVIKQIRKKVNQLARNKI